MDEAAEMSDEELIEELCDIEKGLNDWELEFVANIGRQDNWLSPKQRPIAERIWREHCK